MITDSKEERELINAAIHHEDRDGWEYIYNKYYGAIFGFLRKTYKNVPEEVIEDLTQQTFVRLCTAKTKPTFEHLKQFNRWLYKTTICTVNDYFDTVACQNGKITGVLDENLKCNGSLGIFEIEVNTNEETQIPNEKNVQEVLKQLTERDQKLLIMRSEGTPYSIISKEVGIAENSLGVYYKRAVEKFYRENCSRGRKCYI